MQNLTLSFKEEILELEETNSALTKDKKLLESLMNRVVKSFHNRDMSRLVAELLSLNFSTIQLNSEKSKYEKKMIQMEREQKKLEDNKFSKNFELNQTIMNEKETLRDMILKQENKICK